MKTLLTKTFLLFLFYSTIAFPQWESRYSNELDITPYLQKLAAGQKTDVLVQVQDLKKKYPNDPSVKYLAGILEDDGNKAERIYESIIEHYPKSKYADAALFKVYSFYYSIGFYDKARSYYNKLKKDYPNSPYIKLAQKNIPKGNDLLTELEGKSAKPVNGNNDNANNISNTANETKVDYKYKIQAGAFSKEENAVSLNKDFHDAGYDSDIIQKSVGGTIFHVVIVGKFKSDDEAQSFLQLINSKFNLDGRIIPFDK